MVGFRRARLNPSLAAALVLIVATPASAQRTTGTIAGVVKDESGGALAGVTVVVRNVETGAVRSLVTGSDGSYAVRNLPPSDYAVSAELSGFKSTTRAGIALSVGGEAIVDLTLALGAVTDAIVVTSAPPLIETTSSGLSGVIESQQIRELPLNGRDFIQLSTLQLGVTSARTGDSNQSRGFGTKLSIGGARPTQNRFLLDGSDINDTAGSTPGSAAGLMLGVDTLREFRVLTNAYSAEYGKSAGGVILAVTKSGTNAQHGTAFEFLRNNNLDARNFFDQGPAPPFTRNQFGSSWGGPVVRDRTFFFASYEGLHERLGETRIARVPDNDVRARTDISPVTVPYLKLYPLPNGRSFGGGIAEFITTASSDTDEDFVTARIDHRWSSADSFFVRYSFDDARRSKPNLLLFYTNEQTSRSHYLTAEQTHILSPRLVNTVRMAYNRNTTGDINATTREIDRSLFFVPSHPQFGGISIPGLTELSGGGNEFQPRVFGNVNIDLLEALTFDRGSHSMKVGIGATRYHNDNDAPFRPGGRFEFASLEDFLHGAASRLESMVPGVSDPTRRWRQWLIGTYIQDDWRASPRLTVNLGVRYEFITVPKEVDGKSANLRSVPFSPESTVGPPFRNPSLRNVAPRVGLAWAPGQDDRWSIRTGVGVFYDQILSQYMILAGSRVPPFWVQANPRNPSFPDYIRTVSLRDIDPRVDTIPYDIDQPYRYQYNLSIQRQLASDVVVTAGYVGSRGIHQTRMLADANANIPGGIRDGRLFWPVQSRRQNPVWSTIRYRPTDGISVYNALLLGLTKRYSHGLQVQAAYTFGKSIDDGSTVFQETEFRNSIPVANVFDRTAERGLSDFHVAHSLVANGLWELPFGRGRRWGSAWRGVGGWLAGGWQLSGILNAASGSPFTAVLGFDRARAGAGRAGGGQRPDLAAGSTNPIVGGPDRYFDPSGFALPPAGMLGNLGRNTLIGPGLMTLDVSLFKNSALWSDRNLQFRADIFNLFNRSNFDIPDEAARVVFSASGRVPGAGRITRTATPSRQIQLGVKFIF